MTRRNATNAGFGSPEIRNVGLPLHVVHVLGSPSSAISSISKRTLARLAGKEPRRRFLRDSNLDPYLLELRNPAYVIEPKDLVLVILSRQTSHLFHSFPFPRFVSFPREVSKLRLFTNVMGKSTGKNLLDKFEMR